MRVNPKYIIYHDLIGFQVCAKNKKNALDSAFRDIGTVVDESKHLLVTNNQTNIKKYIKKDHIFRFTLPDSSDMLEVDGTRIVGRPEIRLRSLRRKKWR